MGLKLCILGDTYTWTSLPPRWIAQTEYQLQLENSEFWAVMADTTETTIVTPSQLAPDGIQSSNWRVLEVAGVLPHDLVGITTAIYTPLRDVGVSVMPIAAHRTDYIGVAGDKFATAIAALLEAGFEIEGTQADIDSLAACDVFIDEPHTIPIDIKQLSDDVGPAQFLKVAIDGYWETGLVLELSNDVSLASIEDFIGESTNVAIQVFFQSTNDLMSFVGVRLAGRSKRNQASIILASLNSVRSGGWSSLNKVVAGLRLLIDDKLFPPFAHLLEVGVVGAWKSVGSAIIWQQGTTALSMDALRQTLRKYPALLDPHRNPIGLEFGFQSPLPHWIARQVSKVGDDGHRLDIDRLFDLVCQTSR